ncbi:E3 ubiquitin-protein ligase UPL7 isoform X2 [Physcomitrium patens]|nr:E3 ubiquitin-protein ligase UPL7-like isoform X3 [Physcomitrium patens]|eukprot:XP_024365783.1 E3 ubiquitin-protein ligase UPL7-like isoform X3 [Physcomitrella patens]
MHYNYCDLSVGFPDKMFKWMYQARQLLRLACAALEKEGIGSRESEPNGMDKNCMTLEASNLAGLAMRVTIALTDSSTWKCFDEPRQEVRKGKAKLVALDLLEWLANGNGGLFLAVRSYILANFPVPGIMDENPRPRGKKDKFIITASIITITLRPLLILAEECNKDSDREALQDVKDYKLASTMAAAQFSAHILTIPFLPQRLPPPLLPALQHPTALSPCLRSFGVPIRNLLQMARTSSALPSIPSQQGKVDRNLAGVPLSAWALSNIVCLASHTLEKNSQFVNGLVCQEYVQALCCLLEDLNPWIETIQKRKKAEKIAGEGEDDRSVQGSKIIGIGNETSKTRETVIFQLLVENLRPLHKEWHLLQLMNEAALNDSAPMMFLAAKRSPKSTTKKLFSQSDVAKLYSNLLSVFAVLNPFGGALPILNLLAFTPGLLLQFWDWIQTSPDLAHLLNLDYFQGEPSIKQCVEIQPVKPDKYVNNSRKRCAGSRLAAALGLKTKSKSACFAGSNNSFIVDNNSSGRDLSSSRTPERFLPGRMSVGGVSSTRTPEPFFLPPRRSVDRLRSTPRRSPVGRPISDTPRMTIDHLGPTLRDDRVWRSDVISDRADTSRFWESPQVVTRQGAGLGRRALHGRTEASRSVDIRWGSGGNRANRYGDLEPARRSVDVIRWRDSRTPNRACREPCRPLDILEAIRDMETEVDVAPRTTEMDIAKKGPEGVPEDVLPVLLLFCAAYSHVLVVLDDEEFYEHQEPFTLEQQRVISAVLNTMVYYGFLSTFKRRNSLLMSVAIKCLRSLYERDCRRSFCPAGFWLAPARALRPPIAAAARAHEVAVALEKTGDSSQTPALGAILRAIPHVLPFEERIHIFREFLRSDKLLKMGGEVISSEPGIIEIAVRRDHIVEDGYAQLNGLGSKLKSSVNVSFVDELGLRETGLEHGGFSKDFLTDLAKEAFDPGYGLFVQIGTEGFLCPHAAAGTVGHGLPMLEFLGRIVGKALYEEILLEYSFSPLFLSKLLGRCCFLDDLRSIDAELHRNLVNLKHSKADARDLSLNFTVAQELSGEHSTVELRPGGADIQVTNENKLQYVHAVADYKLNRQMRPLVTAFAKGMADIIDPQWLGLFSAKEFNQLLSGSDHDFDVDDLRLRTRYTGGYTDSSRTIKMFWEVLRGFEKEERCALLKFVTSCSRAPLLGFKYLQPAFTIHRVTCESSMWAAIGGQDVDWLPSASTCYNTLRLPFYRRVSTLREKLRHAIKSSTGFESS